MRVITSVLALALAGVSGQTKIVSSPAFNVTLYDDSVDPKTSVGILEYFTKTTYIGDMAKPAEMTNTSMFHATCYIMKGGMGVKTETYKEKEMKCSIGLLDEGKNRLDWMQTKFKLKNDDTFESSV